MPYRNLSEQLYHELGKQIVNGDIAEKDVLPTVDTLSEMKGVSRTVVRDALKGLSSRKLVESSTKTGTVVLPRHEWQWWDSDVLSWAMQTGEKRKTLLQLTEVRLAIEPAAVRLAAKQATDEDLNYIRKCYEKLVHSTDHEQKWARADYEFHHSILIASHNDLMISLLKTLHKGLVQSRQSTFKILKSNEHSTKDSGEEALAMHRAVMEAVCARNETEAYKKMKDLLLHVHSLVRAL